MQDVFLRLQALINKHAEEYKNLKRRVNGGMRIRLTSEQAIDLFEGWIEFEGMCWDHSVAIDEANGTATMVAMTKEEYLAAWTIVYNESGGCIHYTPPNRRGSLGAEMYPHCPHFRPFARNGN
jgi:hypothetical protein